MERLFETIDALYEEYLDVWEAVCNIESPTRHKEGVDAVGRFFADRARARGWQVEVFPQPVAGDVVCITLNPDAKAAPLALSGHMDTVHPLGSFGTPAVHREGGNIYGPGVDDCKGGIVAAFLAMDALDRCGFTARPVQLLLQSDEEFNLSNKTTIATICEKAKDAVAFLNLEGHVAGTACVIRKGIATFTFTVTGQEAHASACAEAGANAILEAAHKIIQLETWKDPDGLTCNCGVICGGTAVNTVPGQCEFKANVRFATQEQLEWARAEAKRIADEVHVPGCTCVVEQTGGRLAMEDRARNWELLAKMNAIFEGCGLPVLTGCKRKGGSDAADVTAYGIPCVDSIGVEGGAIHSPKEYAVMKSLKESAKRLAAVAAHIDRQLL